jgi:hypothetical protein
MSRGASRAWRRRALAGLLGGLLGLPGGVAAEVINPAIVQTTLNPLPPSVLIPSARFTGSLIVVTSDVPHTFVLFGTSGDLTGDGFPEVVITGWSAPPALDPTGPPPAAPLRVFSTTPIGVVPVDALGLLGVSTLPGTSTPRILDLDGNGLEDFLYLGFNEFPFTNPFATTISQAFRQTAPGQFSTVTLAGPTITSHNSNVGDFDGDGRPDVVASTFGTDGTFFDPDFFAFNAFLKNVVILYVNNGDGTFAPHAMRYTRSISEGFTTPLHGAGSAAAMGDVDGDGSTDIVLTDAGHVPGGDTPPFDRGDTLLISSITRGPGEAFGTITRLPPPYFEDKPEFAAFPSAFHIDKSHDIHVHVTDVDHDGRPDILVSSIIWDATAGTSAGVLQILANRGDRQFEDVTDTSLYNFFLGKAASHQPVFVDVNGDGFVDIVMPEFGNFSPVDGATMPQTWANQLLVNTGTGKFVQAMWNEFHELTLGHPGLAPAGAFVPPAQDAKYIPYLLPDGRLGFVTWAPVFVGGVAKTMFLDFRAAARLSTGPGGTNPAAQGAPGFSEYFYLTEYPDVAAAVAGGQHASGLAHYLAVGRSAGRRAFAPNATIRGGAGVDTLTLDGPRERFAIARVAGVLQVTDALGVHGTLRVHDLERVQFTDALTTLAGPFAGAFLDEPLVAGEDRVKAVHLEDLRLAIDAARTRNGLAAFPWTDPVLTRGVTAVRRIHLVELRAAVAQVGAAKGIPVTFAEEAVTPGATPIRASHLEEVRAVVRAVP